MSWVGTCFKSSSDECLQTTQIEKQVHNNGIHLCVGVYIGSVSAPLRLRYSVSPTHLLLLPTNELCGLFNYYVVCGHVMCQAPDGLLSSLK